jgi:hypothetical protein
VAASDECEEVHLLHSEEQDILLMANYHATDEDDGNYGFQRGGLLTLIRRVLAQYGHLASGRAAASQAAPAVVVPKDAREAVQAWNSLSDAKMPAAPAIGQAPTTEPVELVGVREEVAKGSGFWASCSGCYDTEDGHPTGPYSYSRVFGCALGSGCSECGGIGAVWDNNDYEAMAADLDNYCALCHATGGHRAGCSAPVCVATPADPSRAAIGTKGGA